MKRLGVNRGRYHGESIAIGEVLREIHAAALAKGWRAHPLTEIGGEALFGYERGAAGAARRIYLSTGIHGDEPSGPLAVRQLLLEDCWPEDAAFWLCPCLNPTGFAANTRENMDGIDLNRDFRHLETAEIRALVAWLAQLPAFDQTLVLHEDWESGGFYLYELNPSNLPSPAERIIEAVREVCPIETAELVDDWPCQAGIIRPLINAEERERWPEAVFLIARKSRQSLTLETPSDFALPLRVAAHVCAVRTALGFPTAAA